MFHGYGLLIGIAGVVWWSIVERLEPILKPIIPWMLGLALLGARIYHVIEYWAYYSQDYTRIWQVWEGGLSIWGGLLGGGIVYLWHSRRYVGEVRGRMFAAVVTPLPLAQAIGRLGNAINGEFGQLVWGLPWWGAEALLDLGLFMILWVTPTKYRVIGYILGYGLIRLVLSPYR